jgi:hypothetical protein
VPCLFGYKPEEVEEEEVVVVVVVVEVGKSIGAGADDVEVRWMEDTHWEMEEGLRRARKLMESSSCS